MDKGSLNTTIFAVLFVNFMISVGESYICKFQHLQFDEAYCRLSAVSHISLVTVMRC